MNIRVIDPTNAEILNQDVDLDGDEFEFSFDLDNNAPHGRYAVKVAYGVDDRGSNTIRNQRSPLNLVVVFLIQRKKRIAFVGLH